MDFDNILAKIDVGRNTCSQSRPLLKNIDIYELGGYRWCLLHDQTTRGIIDTVAATRGKLMNCMDGGSTTIINSYANELEDIEEIRTSAAV